MTKHEKVANIMAFLLILFHESDLLKEIMGFSPDYLIEKFERYVLSSRVEYPWGMHPSLKRRCFHAYIEKWQLELNDMEPSIDPMDMC